MKRLWWLQAGALWVLVPSGAAAQALNVSVTEVTGRNGNELNVETLPINEAECTNDDVRITIRVQNIPAGTPVLDFWQSSGSDCSSAEERRSTTTKCEHLDLEGIDTALNGVTDKTFRIPISQLVCRDDLEVGTVTLYILAANTENSTEDVGNNYGIRKIAVDRKPENPPPNVSAGTGNTAIRVSWGGLGSRVREYRVYVDTEAASCEESTLQEGDEVPADLDPATSVNGATSATVNGEDLGLDFEQTARVAVVSVDNAKNVSVLSNTACITRVATEGFCAKLGECDGCAVSAVGGSVGSATTVAVTTGLIAFVLGARRRRSRRRTR